MKSRKLRRTIGEAVLALLVLAGPALAAEAAHEESANPFAGDLGNAFWTLVTFVLVLVVLGKYLWGPILKGLRTREEFIAKSLHDAEAANVTARSLLSEYEQKLEKARAEAAAIVERGRRDAEVVKRTLQDEARKEADAMIARAKREVAIAKDSAKRELFDLTGELATHLASRILSREIKPQDHERLIAETIAELKATAESRS
jgi:F-type H+-transporting ATPase subunit b